MVRISAAAQKHLRNGKTPFLKIDAVVRNCQPTWSGIFAVWSDIFAAEKRTWQQYIRRNSDGLPKKVVLVRNLFIGQRQKSSPLWKRQLCVHIYILYIHIHIIHIYLYILIFNCTSCMPPFSYYWHLTSFSCHDVNNRVRNARASPEPGGNGGFGEANGWSTLG
jgi:hypothetical protein